MEEIDQKIREFFSKHADKIKKALQVMLLLGYFVYFSYSMQHRFGDEGSYILLVITVVLLWNLSKERLVALGWLTIPKWFTSFFESESGLRFRLIFKRCLYVAAAAAVCVYLGIDVFPDNNRNIQSFCGMFVIIFVCFVISSHPMKVNWHAVFWSFMIQFGFAFCTLRTEVGYNAFKWLGDQIQGLIDFSDTGSALVVAKNFKDFGMAFTSTGMIIFINAFISLLNQWGVIEVIVLNLGSFLQFCLGTGPVESVSAAANIFFGASEVPILFRPYLPTITKSELHTIMTCGFASIAGGVMGLFISFGAPANHLLTAAVISAPAALAISKLMRPETEQTDGENQTDLRLVDKGESTSLNAFSEGALMGLTISVAVWSNMIAFVSMLDLLNFVCSWFGDRVGVDGFTFDLICSYVLYPVAFFMGVAPVDCKKVGTLIGVKLFANPVVAYTQLGEMIRNRETFESYISMSANNSWYWQGDDVYLEATNTTLIKGFLGEERSEVITTYALCGFSAVASIGICLGALTPLCPARRKDIIDLVGRAFIAGNMASFATGAVAGVLYTSGQ